MWLSCQEALSQTNSRARLPRSWARATHQVKKSIVTALTGRGARPCHENGTQGKRKDGAPHHRSLRSNFLGTGSTPLERSSREDSSTFDPLSGNTGLGPVRMV